MFWSNNLIVFGLYLATLLYKAHSFVLLTANVEDLKRIAQKFVSDSLADKIARFIIAAADNNIDFNTSNLTKNLSEYNDEFDVEKKDTRSNYAGQFRQKIEVVEDKVKQYKDTKTTGVVSKTTLAEAVQKSNKKVNKKMKYVKNKSKGKKVNKITTDQSSLEYYRSDKQLNKIHPNSIIDIEKIHESDDSSTSDVKQSRKDFKNSHEIKETEEVNPDNVHKYVEKDVSDAIKAKKEDLENLSDDVNYSNRLDTKSEELSTSKTNVTTEIERNEFDQYFNTNYPKAEVVATSGGVELTTTKKDSSEADYD